jgi:RHS repeat-associated protein
MTEPAVGGVAPVTTWAFDIDHLPKSISRADGSIVGFVWDTAGRIEAITAGGQQIAVAYDPVKGTVRSLLAPDGGLLSFVYDGSVTTEQTWAGTIAGTIRRTLDANLRTGTEAIGAGAPITFTYDSDGLLASSGALVLTRDIENGSLSSSTAVGVTESVGYDSFGDLASLSTAYMGSPIFGVQFTRDMSGKIVSRVETIGGVTRTYGYTFDALGQVTAITIDGASAATYSYDTDGNRTATNGVAATYDARQRLLSFGPVTYLHDALGRRISRTSGPQIMRYAYDSFDRVVRVEPPGLAIIEYVFDAVGRRIGRKRAGVLTGGLLYRDALRPAAELDAGGNVVGQFVYGTRAHVPDLIVRGATTFRLVTDHLGSVRLVVNVANGAIAQRIDYDDWGRVLADSSPGFQPFGFAGGLYDAETGLVHFGARDYDPETGRWLIPEPLGRIAGERNAYAYASNDPIDYVDPTGLWSMRGAINNFLAGYADVQTSGFTRIFDEEVHPQTVRDIRPCADSSSSAYSAGQNVAHAAALLGLALHSYRGLLAPPNFHKHHLFPQKYEDWFRQRGINIHDHTVRITEGFHLRSVHGKGDLNTPGRWVQRWDDFIARNPNASAKEAYQFGGALMDEFGLSGLPIEPY